MQKILSAEQVEAFYHDEFVDDQVRHFVAMFGAEAAHKTLLTWEAGAGFLRDNWPARPTARSRSSIWIRLP